MKRIIKYIYVLVLLTSLATVTQAQKSLGSGYCFNLYQDGEIDLAKECIDKQIKYRERSENGRNRGLYFYAGVIYLSIYAEKNPKVNGLDSLAFEKSIKYFYKGLLENMKVANLDYKNKDEKQLIIERFKDVDAVPVEEGFRHKTINNYLPRIQNFIIRDEQLGKEKRSDESKQMIEIMKEMRVLYPEE